MYNLIHSLGLCKSSGNDQIELYFIRKACDYLTYLSQLSFEFGLFSDCLKTVKIIPVFKAGTKSEITNYRPISLLSKFSKILEKLNIAPVLQNFLIRIRSYTQTNMASVKTYRPPMHGRSQEGAWGGMPPRQSILDKNKDLGNYNKHLPLPGCLLDGL